MPPLPLDVQQSLNKQSGKALRRDFEKQTTIEFRRIKAELIKEFLNHPITKEINLLNQLYLM